VLLFSRHSKNLLDTLDMNFELLSFERFLLDSLLKLMTLLRSKFLEDICWKGSFGLCCLMGRSSLLHRLLKMFSLLFLRSSNLLGKLGSGMNRIYLGKAGIYRFRMGLDMWNLSGNNILLGRLLQ
jgi:hypothetical protein